jgi:hypothetical protein
MAVRLLQYNALVIYVPRVDVGGKIKDSLFDRMLNNAEPVGYADIESFKLNIFVVPAMILLDE